MGKISKRNTKDNLSRANIIFEDFSKREENELSLSTDPKVKEQLEDSL
jgi:hypothetical protein